MQLSFKVFQLLKWKRIQWEIKKKNPHKTELAPDIRVMVIETFVR